MDATAQHDLDTARDAATTSADEAFSQLATTEPERSRQANGLEDAIDAGFYKHDMQYLENELGRDRTEEEEKEYIHTWKRRILERKAQEGLA